MWRAAAVLLAAVVSGCTSVMPPAERQALADRIAAPAALLPGSTGGTLPLLVYLRQRDPLLPLTIYIEGDGLAWLDLSTPSDNPTPIDPVALRLAAFDPAANVGWIGRPCQYAGIAVRGCRDNDLWTGARFSEAALAATLRGIDAMARPGQKIHLVGFSGGGAMAALVAARRGDVISLRTVAGTLDHVALNAYHRVSPMPASLNPADSAMKLSALPQRHFVGAKDEIVPRLAADSFLRRETAAPVGCQRLEIVPDATHETGWTAAWPQLLAQPLC